MTRIKEVRRSEDRKTKSTVFIRCMLGYNPSFYGQCFHDTFITIDPNTIVLVFNKANTQKELDISLKIYDILKNNKNYISSTETDFYDILKFNVPEKYVDDFNHFINGKYSKMSEGYKTSLLNLYTQFSDIRTDLYHILYPTDKERKKYIEDRFDVKVSPDAEILSIIDFAEELYWEEDFK